MRKLVCGVGVNDASYAIFPTVNNIKVLCPFYKVWHSMLVRCYSEKHQAKQPAYIGCSVDPEWLSFMNFKIWMEKQNWECRQLDKDLLLIGNKVYSPKACVFVDSMTNLFVVDSAASRGDWPLGVCFIKHRQKFLAQCSNPFTNKKQEFLGYFTCPNKAHLAWKKRKHDLALQLADLQEDQRVAEALRVRYL